MHGTRWIVVGMLVALTVHAAGTRLMKPGLWEVRIVKQTVDGRDMSAQMAGAADQMQQALASMPPAQRAQMEAMLKQRGAGARGNTSHRICVSPAMANRDTPVVDRSGRCQPQSVEHSGNRTSFAFRCTVDGVTTEGKGTSTVDADLIRTHMETSTTDEHGERHVTQTDNEMKFIGPDCGDVKPPDSH